MCYTWFICGAYGTLYLLLITVNICIILTQRCQTCQDKTGSNPVHQKKLESVSEIKIEPADHKGDEGFRRSLY